ncbi:MAG: alpha/beta hydrolase fold domain-containing protein [Fuerstiella sp.]|nr:alpha/beta hydrolase fold domain-containing protein [Fuerstiella sp.]
MQHSGATRALPAGRYGHRQAAARACELRPVAELNLKEIASLPRPRHQVEDTKSAIRFLRANADELGINPDRIVATGTSGGGDLALQSFINRSFEDSNDAPSISPRPNGLVLYCPAFDGIDIWFVKTELLQERTKDDAPAFVAHLERSGRAVWFSCRFK